MPICLRVPISCGPQQLVVRRCSFHGGRGSSSILNCTRVQATWDRGTRSSRVYARASELIEIAKRFCYFIGPPRFGTAFACKARCRELLSGVSLANGWSVLRVTVREHRSTVDLRRIASCLQMNTILYCSRRVALRIRNGSEILKVPPVRAE